MIGMELGWGLDIILWFQSWRSPLVESFGEVFHFLGYTEFYLIVLPLIYWCVNAPAGRRMTLLIVPTIWLNATLKDLWRRPRPFMMSEQVQPVSLETGYGLPSGHVQGATAFGGAAAIESRRRWFTLIVFLYIALMGISRMSMGVHYPQDVIVGTAISLVLVGLYAWLEPPFSRWLGRQSLRAQIGLIGGAATLMLVIHPVLIKVSTPQWLGSVIPYDELLSGPLMLIVIFFTSAVGFALEVRFVGFSAHGLWWQQILRFVVGMLGVLSIHYGLGSVFNLILFRYPPLVSSLIEVGLIGFWFSFLAPWVFVKLGLAEDNVSDRLSLHSLP